MQDQEEIEEYYPFPMWIVIAGFVIILLIVGFIYLQYISMKTTCQALI